jgi:Icc-related predicted phosphoesterase
MKVEADYLFIAGDTIEAKWFEFAMNPNSGKFGEAQKLVEFFQELSKHYYGVYVIMGNHEHYYGMMDNTLETMNDFFKLYGMSNTLAVENEFFMLNEKLVFAGTGWTDMGGPNNYWYVKNGMNDFRLIRKAGYSRFSPEDAVRLHVEFLNRIKAVKPDVILMHHAPTAQSIHPHYAGDTLNGAYYSQAMENVLAKWSKPLIIVHGHTHYPVDYMFGDNVRVVSNPKGYGHLEQFKLGVFDV